VYKNLNNHTTVIPPDAELSIQKMIQEDWLRGYGSVEGIDNTFKRMSKRLRRENTLYSAVEELEKHYQALNSQFLGFFPQLINHFNAGSKLG
jgi:acyl carrier protein phosphodiesterase